MICHLCKSNKLYTIYEGPIRSGGADSEFINGYQVLQCKDCKICFLDPFPNDIETIYSDYSYYQKRLGKFDIQNFKKKFDNDQLRWLFEIGVEQLRDKRICDFGCGAGLFLDLVKGITSETIGIDKGKFFQNILEKNGHKYFQHSNDIAEGNIDVAVSFDTLEHVPKPEIFLNNIYRKLKPGGLFYVAVPNFNDYLKEIVPAYLKFFYHKSHLFYYNSEVLENLLHHIGFKNPHTKFVHKYDLMNLIIWARDGKGSGKVGSLLFDKNTEDDFRFNLERQGIASHILIKVNK